MKGALIIRLDVQIIRFVSGTPLAIFSQTAPGQLLHTGLRAPVKTIGRCSPGNLPSLIWTRFHDPGFKYEPDSLDYPRKTVTPYPAPSTTHALGRCFLHLIDIIAMLFDHS